MRRQVPNLSEPIRILLGVFLTLVLLAPGMAVDHPRALSVRDPWQIECVDCPAWFVNLSDRTLRLDDNSHAHLAYGGDHLYYAVFDGAAWTHETVDSSPRVSACASLDLDQAGLPHISYYDDDTQSLKYACRDSAGWRTEVVDDAGGRGVGSSIAVDSQGMESISYYDAHNRDLLLARRLSPLVTPTPSPTRTPLPKAGSAYHADSPPTIDGDLSDWPALPGVLLDRWNAADHGGILPTPADLSTTCYHQWSATHLYAGCLVNDDVIMADSGADWWHDDTLELVYDGLDDDQSYGADDHKFDLRVDGGFSDYGTSPHPGLAVAWLPWAGGYAVELAIPAPLLGEIPLDGDRVIGLNIGLIDDDDGGESDAWLGWSGNTYRRAHLCGDLTLLPGDGTPTHTTTSTSTATMTPTPTAVHTPTRTPTATRSPSPTGTPTATRTPSPVTTTTPTATRSPSPTGTPTATRTPSPVTTTTPTSTTAASVTPSPTSQPGTRSMYLPAILRY